MPMTAVFVEAATLLHSGVKTDFEPEPGQTSDHR